MKTKTLSSVALMALVLAAATIGATGAGVSDSATSTANTFTSGKLDLKLTDGNETSLDSVSASITAAALRPGDFTVAPLTIVNPASPTSTLNLRYAMTSSSTNADAKNLAGTLLLRILPVTNAASCTISTNFSTASNIYGGTTGAALSGASFGSTTAGFQAGDRPSTGAGLTPGSSDALCFRIDMPTTAPDGTKSATTTATFTFAAEQTGNNP